MPAADTVLVVGPSWVGDMVMAQALFMQLKHLRPDCEIDVLAPAWSLPIIARMPEVRAGVKMPLGHGEFGFGLRRKLGRSLRGKYTQAIVLPGSWKSALVGTTCTTSGRVTPRSRSTSPWRSSLALKTTTGIRCQS